MFVIEILKIIFNIKSLCQYGDSPTCMDLGNTPYFGKNSTIQGYGKTENGTRGDLLETTVTVIENQECRKQLKENITRNREREAISEQFCTQLPLGINEAFLCSQGILNDEGVFTGPCKGDSGGPLTVPSDENRDTLIGIISGKSLLKKKKLTNQYIFI